jgi:ribosomal protein S18 acetylase RimI-like enzyme
MGDGIDWAFRRAGSIVWCARMSLLSDREATVDDYPVYVHLYPELGKDAPVIDRDKWVAEMVHRTIFLERGGSVVAYAVCNLYESNGYVVQIVVDPRVRREGIGRSLLGVLAARFRRAGCSTWSLDVKVDNAPAIALYESVGLRTARRSTSLRLTWAAVDRLPRDGREVVSEVVDPADDEALEAAFDLPRGQLAVLRTRKGRIQVRLVDVAEPSQMKVGVGVVDRSWPGVFPFRVARPTLAAELLLAARVYLPAGPSIVNVVADGDPELLRILKEAGAEVIVETLYMQGALPDHPTLR